MQQVAKKFMSSAMRSSAPVKQQSRSLYSTSKALHKAGTWMPGKMGQDTDCVHSVVTPEPATGAILTPVYMSSTFVQDSVEE